MASQKGVTRLNSYRDKDEYCYANVRMESGEPVYISIAMVGVLVIKSRIGFFGTTLFKESNANYITDVCDRLFWSFND
jgi:hypothetical protein